MLPDQLKIEQFRNYPPEAREIAVTYLALLQQLPLSFVPLLMRELIQYDWKFPAERLELDNQFRYLTALSSEQLQHEMEPFARLRLSSALEQMDWVNAPVSFSEKLSAYLWATHQIEAFRTASIEYVHRVNSANNSAEALPVPRLGIVLIGADVAENRYRLFRKLRPEGVYFTNVHPDNGRRILLDAVITRAQAHPVRFGHWYIDGADTDASGNGLTCISYDALGGMRVALVQKMRKVMQSGAGPEVLASMLAQMSPEELGLPDSGDRAVLNRFQVSILAEGSGTQLFSTSFVQWSAREALRRAQPLTLLARFTPRQQEQSMRELLAGSQQKLKLDPAGSLIDADMGAYYTWINQQRLRGAEQASFLVWFEDHNEALAIGPSLGRGTQDNNPVDLAQILNKLI